MSTERIEAVQAVVDRQTSYQDSATAGTVEKELREALAHVDAEVTEDEIAQLVAAIEKADEPVDVATLLG